jgi:methyl-accepting chemotaxis protein
MVTARDSRRNGATRMPLGGPPRWPLEASVGLAAFLAGLLPALVTVVWCTGSTAHSAPPAALLALVVVLAALLALVVVHTARAPLRWLASSSPAMAPRLPRRGVVGALTSRVTALEEAVRAVPSPDAVGQTAFHQIAQPVSAPPQVQPISATWPAGDLRAATLALTSQVMRMADEARRQAPSISRTIRQMEAMAVSASSVSERTTQAETVAGDAVTAVGSGQEALAKAQAAMALIRETTLRAARQVKVLGESAQFVRQAVGQVQYNADELHLIAGNASIEAARHPESAGFFRNVADSIEQLAQQSQVALAEIQQAIETNRQETGRVAGVIEDMVAEVERGSMAVGAAGSALQTISDVVALLATLNQAIAAASREQVRVATTVAEGIDMLAGGASDTSRGMAEGAALAARVRELAAGSTISMARTGVAGR